MGNKIVIVGGGSVGFSYAYALLNQKTKVDEIIFIDNNYKKTLGNSIDLNHGASFAPSKISIKAGEYKDCKDAKIVVFALENKVNNKDKLSLINENNKLLKEQIEYIVSSGFDGIFLVATYPVDIMCYIVRKYSNFSSNKVIGSGTTLDTARLRYLLSKKIDINSKNVHAYMIGEQGDNEFAMWSSATAGVIPIKKMISKTELETLELNVKLDSSKVLEYKGTADYAMGMCLVRITNSILSDECSVLTVSAPVEDIYIGVPAIVNKDGIKGVMKIGLSDEEYQKFENSKNVIKDIIRSMEE